MPIVSMIGIDFQTAEGDTRFQREICSRRGGRPIVIRVIKKSQQFRNCTTDFQGNR
jgi:hypothetical protein